VVVNGRGNGGATVVEFPGSVAAVPVLVLIRMRQESMRREIDCYAATLTHSKETLWIKLHIHGLRIYGRLADRILYVISAGRCVKASCAGTGSWKRMLDEREK